MEQLSRDESVLEHVGFVAAMSLVLAAEVNAKGPDEIDIGVVLTKAVIHDFDEIVTGDIPRPTKYSSPEAIELFHRIKTTGLAKVTGHLDSTRAFCRLLETSHDEAKVGREGLIVAIADMLAVVYMVWREVIVKNNFSVTRQAYTVMHQIAAVKKRVETELSGDARMLIADVLEQAILIAGAAADRDEPIHASIRED